SFVVSEKVWKTLPADVQTALETWWEWMYMKKRHMTVMKDRELVALDKSGKGEKVTVVNWSPEERMKLREVAKQAWLDFSKKSEFAKKVYDAHVEFMTKMALL
ncbi:MAG: hypothetical protein MI741_21865, partial [Rhodospirillales bacterium]|nr:hypothetical protein [Rhodospirillales bacterium]